MIPISDKDMNSLEARNPSAWEEIYTWRLRGLDLPNLLRRWALETSTEHTFIIEDYIHKIFRGGNDDRYAKALAEAKAEGVREGYADGTRDGLNYAIENWGARSHSIEKAIELLRSDYAEVPKEVK